MLDSTEAAKNPGTGKTDEEIAREVQNGTVSSFGVLMQRYEPKLTRYGRKFLINGEDIKDLLQEVFIKAYMNMQSFDTSRKFSSWIYRIAHNEFVNALKKRSGKLTLSLSDFDTILPHPAAKEDIESDAERRELRIMLEKGVQSLDPKYREPLVLYYFEDMNYREIAEIMHTPVSTVGVRLQRGKNMLKKAIRRDKLAA